MSDFAPEYVVTFEGTANTQRVSPNELAELLFSSDRRFRLVEGTTAAEPAVTGIVLNVGLITRASHARVCEAFDRLQIAHVAEEASFGGAIESRILVPFDRGVSLDQFPAVFDAASRVLTRELAHGGERDPLEWASTGRYALSRVSVSRGLALSVDALLDPEYPWMARGGVAQLELTSIVALGHRDAGEELPWWKACRVARDWKRAGRVGLGQLLDDVLEGRSLHAYEQRRAMVATTIDELARALPGSDPRQVACLFMPSVRETEGIDLEMHELRFLAHDAVMRQRRILAEEAR
ncbi:hypothetical protein [Sandaracinus amylolyticus]|uniref:hypothetical protein n=1 Tax=Sandaracinus amylolyticus TaxID=927083 RepID=UPI001F32D914|nr:hypothetical protein [Sandaracinus amylolyticus]UJR83636.1 Hypothetical protein I5071_57050 [Sandaracinus amylolyticus]